MTIATFPEQEQDELAEAELVSDEQEPTFITGPRVVCGSCGGGTHRHGNAASADYDCWWQQFLRARGRISSTGKVLKPTPRLLREFADWLDQGNAFRRPPRNNPGRKPEDPGDRMFF